MGIGLLSGQWLRQIDSESEGGEEVNVRDHAVWRRPDMRRALAVRDVAMVFQILQRYGISQRRIAASTGQSQSEISEILKGRRVVSYDVLVRIALGLGVPRGHLGLAYDEETRELIEHSEWITQRLEEIDRFHESDLLPSPARLGDQVLLFSHAPHVKRRVHTHVVAAAPAEDGEVSTADALVPVPHCPHCG
jgi:transcriptional regulator with XRE-family HTH domain